VPEAAPLEAPTSFDVPTEPTPDITLPEINVVASAQQDKAESKDQEPNAVEPGFGTFNEIVDAITNAIVGQAQAASPVNEDIMQQDQTYDPFQNTDPNKDQDRIEPSQPGAVPPEALGKSDQTEEAQQQDPFETQQEAFNTFGIEPGFFGAQPVEQATQAAIAAAPGMNQDLEQAAQPSVQEEQQSTTKADQPQSMTPTPVSTISVTQTPEQIAAQFGTTPDKKEDDPFGVPETFAAQPTAPVETSPLAAMQEPSAPVAAPTTPVETSQLTELQDPMSPLFDPTPMNPAQPAPPVEVAQLEKADRENPSTREFDPTIFDPATYAPSAPPVEVAQAPQAAPPASPIEVAQNAPPPGQIQAPAAISGIPAGVPADVPSSVPSGALTNDDIVSLPRQQLAMVQEVQRQKDIKDKRDAIAKAMMGQDQGVVL
jgi:hypothetical protein